MPRRLGDGSIAGPIGARIRSLREAACVTQEKLAWGVNLDKSYLSLIETGRRVPALNVIVAIADYLDVHPLDIVGCDLNDPRSALLDAIRRGDELAVRLVLEQFLPGDAKAKNPPR